MYWRLARNLFCEAMRIDDGTPGIRDGCTGVILEPTAVGSAREEKAQLADGSDAWEMIPTI